MNKIFLMVVFLSGMVGADNYYVSKNGTYASDGSIGSPTVLRKANENLTPGDTCFIRGNTPPAEDTIYIGATDGNTEGIYPHNSGTQTNPIVYIVYYNEKVRFVGNSTYPQAVLIENKNWIKVIGFNGSGAPTINMSFVNMYTNCWIHDGTTTQPYGTGSDYNEISYCVFGNSKQDVTLAYRGSTIYHNSKYNWIHNCFFHDHGAYPADSTDAGALLEIGYMDCGVGEDSCMDTGTYANVIENNVFYHGGHHTVSATGNRHVFRNNVFHNEQYYQSSVDNIWYGYRIFMLSGENNSNFFHGFNLVEGNRFSHATNNFNSSLGGTGINVGNANNIIRFNDMYANAGNTFYVENHSGLTTGRVSFNHIYNNSFLSNGYGCTFPNATLPLKPPYGYRGSSERSIIHCVMSNSSAKEYDTTYYGNVIKNNVSWKEYGLFATAQGINSGFTGCPDQTVCGDWVFDHNWVKSDGDPKFSIEGDYGDPSVDSTDQEWYWKTTPNGVDITTLNSEPNFTLQSSSPCIQNGTYLTLANGAGNNTSELKVDDPKYFQPGWGNGAGGGAVVSADWITIGSTSNTAQILSIDYTDSTITLTSAKTWADDAQIRLYKNSSGTTVLYGSETDQGAHPYSGAASKKYGLLNCIHK